MKEQWKFFFVLFFLFGLITPSFGDDPNDSESVKSIRITGLGTRYYPFYGGVHLSTNGTIEDGPFTTSYPGLSDGTLFPFTVASHNNGIFTGVLFFGNFGYHRIWSDSGSYFVLLTLTDGPNGNILYYVSKEKIYFKNNITELSFPKDFNFIRSAGAQ